MRRPVKSLVGRRVRLVRLNGAAKAKPGDLGTVTLDEGPVVHVNMDGGERLALVYKHGDRFDLVA